MRMIASDKETSNGYGLCAKTCCVGFGFLVGLRGKEIPLHAMTIGSNGQIHR